MTKVERTKIAGFLLAATAPSAIALPILDLPETIFEVVDCSSVSALSASQRSHLSSLGFTKCCTTGDYNVLVSGTDDYPDAYLLTASNVIAELLDRDLDGRADNVEVWKGVRFAPTETANAVPPPLMHGAPTQEQEMRGDDIGDGENFAYAFSLQTHHAWDDEDPRPIIVEEVFHMLTQFGWGQAYPDLFGSEDFASSLMCEEMAKASCVHWTHPENFCEEPGVHEQPPLAGGCNEADCDCVEWFHQVALILGGIEPGWYGNLIPRTMGKLRPTLSPSFLEVMDDPLYAMPERPIDYRYVAESFPLTESNETDVNANSDENVTKSKSEENGSKSSSEENDGKTNSEEGNAETDTEEKTETAGENGSKSSSEENDGKTNSEEGDAETDTEENAETAGESSWGQMTQQSTDIRNMMVSFLFLGFLS